MAGLTTVMFWLEEGEAATCVNHTFFTCLHLFVFCVPLSPAELRGLLLPPFATDATWAATLLVWVGWLVCGSSFMLGTFPCRWGVYAFLLGMCLCVPGLGMSGMGMCLCTLCGNVSVPDVGMCLCVPDVGMCLCVPGPGMGMWLCVSGRVVTAS